VIIRRMGSHSLAVLAVVAGVTALGPTAAAQITVPEIAARMQAAVAGGAPATAAGDLELAGRLELPGLAFELHILLRREPFTYREEQTWIPAPGARPDPPRGIARRAVFISTGTRCWNLADEVGPAGPMTGLPAVTLLDNSLLFRLLLDPQVTLAQVPLRTPRLVTDELGHAASGEDVLFLAWPHGTCWLAHIARDSGRLTTLLDSTQVTRRWYRLGDWRPLADGLVLPTRIEEGLDDTVGVVIRITSARAGLSHADALFPDAPDPPLAPVTDVARLLLVPHPIPGAGSVVFPEGTVQGERGALGNVWTLFDTGASGAYVQPDLADALGLLRLGAETSFGVAGGGVSLMRWIDRLQLGRHPLLQLPAASAPFPPHNEVPAANAPGVVLGGPRLIELSPVLDLRAGRLLLRGRTTAGAVRPLSEITGKPALAVPLRDDGKGRPLVELSLGGAPLTALLDTGMPFALRLARSDLRRLGLPDDDANWLARGALPYRVTGVHGHGRDELLVRLEQDALVGPVTLRRPWVLLASADLDAPDAQAEFRSLVGCGALTAFEQVGFDWSGKRLELVAPAGVLVAPAVGAPGAPRAVVPPPGAFLGFILGPPDAGATSRPHNLPHVLKVIAGTPAARAGLQAGDMLVDVAGAPCDGLAPMDVWERLRVSVGDAVEVRIVREETAGDLVLHIEA